jgi:hypothetical protein
MVVAAAVGARSHRDDPARIGHLIVDPAEGGGHLVGEGARDDDHVSLARGGSEDNTIPVHVVPGRGDVHHLDGAAGEAEGKRPQGAFPAPVCKVVDAGKRPLDLVRLEVNLERGVALLLLRNKVFRLRCKKRGTL